MLCEFNVTLLLVILCARNGSLFFSLLFLKGKATIVPASSPRAARRTVGSASPRNLDGSADKVYSVICHETTPSGSSYIAQIIEAFVR